MWNKITLKIYRAGEVAIQKGKEPAQSVVIKRSAPWSTIRTLCYEKYLQDNKINN